MTDLPSLVIALIALVALVVLLGFLGLAAALAGGRPRHADDQMAEPFRRSDVDVRRGDG